MIDPTEFHPGTYVRCINAEGVKYLKQWTIYEILRVFNHPRGDGCVLELSELPHFRYAAGRFRPAVPTPLDPDSAILARAILRTTPLPPQAMWSLPSELPHA